MEAPTWAYQEVSMQTANWSGSLPERGMAAGALGPGQPKQVLEHVRPRGAFVRCPLATHAL